MKQRVRVMLSLVVLILLLVQPSMVGAAEAANTSQSLQVSDWAISDLVFGETYGVYPLSWYEDGFTAAIEPTRFRNLLGRVRHKILDTESVIPNDKQVSTVGKELTVKKALQVFYELLSSYDYQVDMGLQYGLDPVTYMTSLGIYTGQNGEQALDEIITVEQSVIIASRLIAVVYEAVDASSKGFLWQVESNGNKVYLLGSIHLANSSIYPFSAQIWQAFYNADGLVVEAYGQDEETISMINQLAIYPEGESLIENVSEETYQKIVELGKLMALPEETLATIKPWYLYLLFSNLSAQYGDTSGGTSAALGIDQTFINQAYLTQKPLYQIESYMMQAEMLDGFSKELQEILLIETIITLEAIMNGEEVKSADINSMYELWKEGDVEGFKKEYPSVEIPDTLEDEELIGYLKEFKEKFMTNRDLGMAEYIDNILKLEGNNTYFVVVGAAHYISDYSVIDILEEKGYEVIQIK